MFPGIGQRVYKQCVRSVRFICFLHSPVSKDADWQVGGLAIDMLAIADYMDRDTQELFYFKNSCQSFEFCPQQPPHSQQKASGYFLP